METVIQKQKQKHRKTERMEYRNTGAPKDIQVGMHVVDRDGGGLGGALHMNDSVYKLQ